MILSALLLIPIIGAICIALGPSRANYVRILAFAVGLIEFGLSLFLLSQFDTTTAQLQMVEKYNWIPEIGVSYFLGIDGLSLWLVILTNFLVPLMVLGSWKSIEDRPRLFHACLFLLQTAMLGTFLSIDVILFYVFWELSLIPMYFMVGIWGGARRIYATIKFFIFTMAGSVLMLLAIIYMMFLTKSVFGQMSASLLDFYQLQLPFIGDTFLNPQTLLFFAFAVAFAIKIPMFPLHTWLPDAHVEAPTPGSVILAGVMLKMGTYGFLRFVLPLFPEAVAEWSWLFLVLGVVGIVYGALVAMVQPDIKKLVAYSSVSHMGYILIGLFALNQQGVTGGLYQMLNHGVSTGALFFLVGMIYERTHTRQIADYGGLAKAMPWYTIAFLIITFSSIAVPLTNGFIGEFLILIGTFKTDVVLASVATTGAVFGAAYMLWMVKKVFYGPAGKVVTEHKEHLHDLTAREVAVLVPLIILVFWMGLFPNQFLSKSAVSVDYLVKNISDYRLEIKGQAEKPAVAQGQKEANQ